MADDGRGQAARPSWRSSGHGQQWVDHIPPWVSWCALAVGGAFSALELLLMALPLLVAAAVELARLDLSRLRRNLEAVGPLVVAGCWLAKVGWVMTVILLVFTLCGARLALHRGKTQSHQVLLMAFLLFLLTAVANPSISFLPFALLWTAVAARTMLFNSWGGAGALGMVQGTPPPRAVRHTLSWTAAAGLLACLVFWVVPRPEQGWLSPLFGAGGLGGAVLRDEIALAKNGAVRTGSRAVARILPTKDLSTAELMEMESRMPLLIGFRLEQATQGRWEKGGHSPKRHDVEIQPWGMNSALEYFTYPTPTGLIPLPQGLISVAPPPNTRIELLVSGETRWGRPTARPTPFGLSLGSIAPETIAVWEAERRGLMSADPETTAALNWSLRVAPSMAGMHADELADTLAKALRGFRYTLDNPSGGANDPLGDFLVRSRAGHCEYFAHALASALRHRGIASRVVVGYRLGPWIDEGGYWLVTQKEAHSWVEYVSPEKGEWVSIDPTPAVPADHSGRRTLSERLSHAMDALRFRWDRYVVRFSGAEQRAGLSWAQVHTASLWSHLRGTNLYLACTCAVMVILSVALWKMRGQLWHLLRPIVPPGAILPLRPLIRASKIQPLQGETVRSWLRRLCEIRPDRCAPLEQLTNLVEDSVYGNSGEDIAHRAIAEARAWKEKAKGTE